VYLPFTDKSKQNFTRGAASEVVAGATITTKIAG